jgi:hypothetical protein
MIYSIYAFKEYLKKVTPNFIKNIFPRMLRVKIYSKIFPFYFIPTNLNKLPNINFIDDYNNLDTQHKYIDKFYTNFKQNSEMTFPNLTQELHKKFNADSKFKFLDIGGEYIDFYLELNKNFKNIEYYFHNIENINNIFNQLKKNYNFNNLFIIDRLEEISNNHFDFINLGASLQYIEDYEILLDKITNLKSYVLISAIPVYKSKNKSQNKFIIVKQAKNSAGNYLYFFNKDYLFSIFKNKNFDIILEQDNPTDNVNLKNFEKIVDEISYLDLIFHKK